MINRIDKAALLIAFAALISTTGASAQGPVVTTDGNGLDAQNSEVGRQMAKDFENQVVFSLMDTNEDNSVSFQEYMLFITPRLQKEFYNIDQDGDGVLSFSEMPK